MKEDGEHLVEPPIASSEIEFSELMDRLYKHKQAIVSIGFRFSKNEGDRCEVQLQDPAGAVTAHHTSDRKAIDHLLRFKKTHHPEAGPVMLKVHDMNAHWAAWDAVTKVSQKDRDEARRQLLAGKASIAFPWTELLHDAMRSGHGAFDSRFIPLRENHTLLLAHVELLGMQAVQKLDKLEKGAEFKDAVALVRETLGFVESPDGFLPRLLDMPGGPGALEQQVRFHAGVANEVVNTLAERETPNRAVNLYTALATYSTMIEALRVPLRIIAKCLDRTHPHAQGSTDGSLTELVDYLCSHPKVGAKYAAFLDADIRHSFAHAWYRFTKNGVDLVDQNDPRKVRRTISVDELFDKLGALVIKFTPAALYGSLMTYHLDARLMMQTIPYAEWLVGVSNVKR